MTTAQQWVTQGAGGLDRLALVQVEVPEPGPGEVTIRVAAAGMNPADWKQVVRGGFDDTRPIGYEVSGVIAALGPDVEIAPGGGRVGDEVIAFRVTGGYTTALTVPAADVLAKPEPLDHPAAANLLLAGAAAAEMLHVAGVREGDTVLLHGASGGVGLSVLQQARLLGAHVVGTTSDAHADLVRRFGGTPVRYGVPDMLDRLRAAAPGGFAAALDAVGTDEAVDASLALVGDRDRVVTIAAFGRAQADGFPVIGGAGPESAGFRDRVRARLVELADRGALTVPVARTFPLVRAREALDFLRQGHPGGKVALVV